MNDSNRVLCGQGGIARTFPDPSLYSPAQAKLGWDTPMGGKCMSRVFRAGLGHSDFVPGLEYIAHQGHKLWRGVMVALRNSRSGKCNVNMARMATFALVIAFVHLVRALIDRLHRIQDSHS